MNVSNIQVFKECNGPNGHTHFSSLCRDSLIFDNSSLADTGTYFFLDLDLDLQNQNHQDKTFLYLAKIKNPVICTEYSCILNVIYNNFSSYLVIQISQLLIAMAVL